MSGGIVIPGHLDDAVHALKEAWHVEDVLRLWFHRPRCLQENILKAPTTLHKYGHIGMIYFLPQRLLPIDLWWVSVFHGVCVSNKPIIMWENVDMDFLASYYRTVTDWYRMNSGSA